ncbi:MAG: hypothetical protein JOZ65_13220 [Chloroflexi bacterium]|nr:hypothetical protein [Chloroflexota bacterium]
MTDTQRSTEASRPADVPDELAWVVEGSDPNDHVDLSLDRQQPARTPTFFMHAPFARRLLRLFLRAIKDRTRHVPHALTGSGKSTAIRELLRCFPGEKQRNGRVHMPIVAMRAPNRDEPGVRDFGKKLARNLVLYPACGGTMSGRGC